MAKPKIIWSNRAKIKRYEILEFYIKRNKSNAYSRKLNNRINAELRLVLKYPDSGIKTNLKNIRGLIIGHFILFYEIAGETIFVHYIWDSRQDPDRLVVK